MRSLITKSVLLAALVLCVGGSARAATLEAHVPFPFTVHGRTLPSGRYRVATDDTNPAIVSIRGEHGTTANTFVLSNPAPGRDPKGDTPALVFTRHENQYRLTDIWSSRDEGREVTGSW